MAETLNPVPVCEKCGEETSRVRSVASKGRYQCTNLDCDNKTWYIRGSKKAEEKQLYTPEEREEMIEKVNQSIAKDYDGSRRRYADSVSTSQALIRRAATGRAQLTNGKGP